MDLAKLKVAELKAELAARNLDTKGVKAVLLERLKEAIERESNATTAAAVGLSGAPQFQAQHHFLLQQQQQQQQQQLFLQQQQLQEQQQQQQQQLLLQHQQLLQQQQQQQQLQQLQQTFNAVPSEVLQEHDPQEQAIEDLSMPNKRAETPVRRSRRRSMTRSPSPTNSLGEHTTPAASLLGSARKRGRSRSMTKSPSPQRLAEAASCLEAVQEEPEPPVTVAVADERLDAQMELTDTVWPEVKGEDSNEQSFDAFVAADHTQLLSEKSEDTLGSSVPDAEPVFAMDTEAPEVKPPSSLLGEDDVRRDENQEAEDPLAADESSNVATEDEVSPLPPAELEQVKVELKTEVDEGDEDQTVEPQEADEKVLKTEPEPAASGGEEKGKESSDAGNKKQTQHTNTIEFLSEEIEPQLADESSKAQLSWYDSDINLMVNPKDCLSAKPLSDGIFGLVWGGARANRGFAGGRVFYEVSVGDELQPATRSPFVPEGEECTPEIRIGWSKLADGKRNLGETACSFGYASSGQKVSGGTFEEYGATFGKHDVVGAYLDMESQPCSIQFTLNRVRQGAAFEFEKDSLDGAALFPHVYTKNLSFKINFGTVQEGFPLKVPEKVTVAKEESDKASDDKADADSSKDESQKSADPEAEVVEKESKAEAEETQEKVAAAVTDTSDAVATDAGDAAAMDAGDAAVTDAGDPVATESVPFDPEFHFCDRFIEENAELIVEGLKGPPTRDCCELIMMIGLPGSGKTHWVENYLRENPESSFTVLSVNSLLENMKILAQPREPSNTPQWQKVIEQLTRNIGRLIEIACKRRRHILVDQTNVFSSEQKRRLRGFGGFKSRRAVAVIPSVEEYKRRYEEKVAKYGKEVPDTNLNTMKANIFVPSAELKLYTEIMFPELPDTEAREMIKKLNEEGRKLIPPRRQRGNQSNRNHHNQKNSGSSNSSNSYTSRWNHNRSQGQYANKTNRYGSGSGGGGGSGGSGYNRYGNKSNDSSQYHHQHHRAGGDYRSGGGNGYGRRDDQQRGGGGYGGGGGGGGNRYDSWSRNSGGYYNDRGYTNRGYQQQQQDHSNNRYDARRRDRRGYNSSGWNGGHGGQQQQQQWNNYGGNSGTSDTWYSWWQSNLKNLLHQGGGQNGGSGGDQSGSSSGAYWNQQYGQHQNASSSYGNYHSKGGSGGSSNIGSN
ncbi:heterogeneous nuclear ribonucleoprotein U-like protein 2 [Anopheles cruzii]|uniref:heterogeneous nuclear ribonucleoprotein U-like protein 2 n=1 Tax=Anopheles cruzii TaxID=68878 RepID=UPI0022EC64A3|nr:heterogeneous nuclear ribonucleoprotein U-like protein 2 [Anopheles cruzii]